jgi:hypothetical protein
MRGIRNAGRILIGKPEGKGIILDIQLKYICPSSESTISSSDYAVSNDEMIIK